MNGFRLNVELKGGSEASYAVSDNSLTSEQISRNLEAAGLRGGNVQFATVDATKTAGAHREVDISLPPQPGITGTDQQNLATIAKAAAIPNDPNAQYQKIGPQIQAETERNAGLGVVLSSGLIIIFLAFRFGTGFGGFGK
jgi:preprotein translocase subunit SecF